MWPWEHAIVGYLAYSLFARVYSGKPPTGRETLVVVVAAVLPDLIDKPLAWEFRLFESGFALGHSIFFAVPLSIAVGLLARARRSTRVGVAFAAGYLLHLPGDILFQGLTADSLAVVLWPVATTPPYGFGHGFLENFERLFERYLTKFLAGDLTPYMWGQVALAGAATFLWIADGVPVLRECLRGGRRLTRFAIGR